MATGRLGIKIEMKVKSEHGMLQYSDEFAMGIKLLCLRTKEVREFIWAVYSGGLYTMHHLQLSTVYPLGLGASRLLGTVLKRRVHVFLVAPASITARPEVWLRVE